MSFWGELKRRNVFKVGAAYLIAGWLILQVASITFPALNLPGWALTLVTVLLIIGFIIAIILAWAYEVTPEGVKRSENVPLDESITHVTGRKLNYVLGGLLIIAVALLIFDNYYLDRRPIEPEVASTVTEQTPAAVDVEEAPKTIAVLPFENLSSETEQGYFVDGLSEEILNSLTQVPNLRVIARTSSFSFKGTNKKVQEIADELGANYILEGSVRKSGDAIRITAQLIQALDGIHLWSKTYDRVLKDIFAVQEDIATTVADELKLTLGIGSTLKQMGGTDNEKAYEYYLVAKGQQWDYTTMSRALTSVDAAIAIDPEFARAWALKATLHIMRSAWGPGGQADSHREDALYAAQKAVGLDPNLAAGYVSLGFTKMAKGEWIGAESSFHKALELSDRTLSSDEIIYIANHYMGVGYFKKAVDLLGEWRRNDPLNQMLRVFYIEALTFLGDHQRAKEEFEDSREVFGEQAGGFTYLLATIRPDVKVQVDLDEVDVTTREAQIIAIALKNFESPEKGLNELRQLYQDEKDLSSFQFIIISTCAAYLGGSDFAMDAMEKGYEIDPTGLFWIWLPVEREIRQTPRFKEFIREIGHIEYWDEFGWPDICHKLDNGDFVCD